MICASKSTLSLNNLKILKPKVTKNLKNLRKKFCESPPRSLIELNLGKRCVSPATTFNMNNNFWIAWQFFEVGSSLKPNQHKYVKLAQIHITHCTTLALIKVLPQNVKWFVNYSFGI